MCRFQSLLLATSKIGLFLKGSGAKIDPAYLKRGKMSARKVKGRWSALLLVVVMVLPWSVAVAPASHAQDECGFGLYVSGYDDTGAAICENTVWKIINNNDGFDRVVEGLSTIRPMHLKEA